MKKTILIAAITAIAFFSLVNACFADANFVKVVPTDYATIQGAVDHVMDKGVVKVMPGTYSGPGNHDIDFGGKNIIVTASNSAVVHTTIIDCENQGRAFYFHNNETSYSKIIGLTIRNGSQLGDGGAILCEGGANPEIINCVIEQCEAENGSAIACDASLPRIENCLIAGNSATESGAIYAAAGSNPQIIDCTIANNNAFGKAGISVDGTSVPTVINGILSGNISENGEKDVIPSVAYSGLNGDIRAAGVSNLKVSADFATGPSGAYYLNSLSSPMLNAGSPARLPYGSTKITGAADTGIIDMGFHYNTPNTLPQITNVYSYTVNGPEAIYTHSREGIHASISDDKLIKRIILLKNGQEVLNLNDLYQQAYELVYISPSVPPQIPQPVPEYCIIVIDNSNNVVTFRYVKKYPKTAISTRDHPEP